MHQFQTILKITAMSQAILNQILDQLQMLEPSELQHLSQAIQRYLPDREIAAKRVAFHRALIESGLVRQIRSPACLQGMRSPLIQIQGNPVSQTIIEERR